MVLKQLTTKELRELIQEEFAKVKETLVKPKEMKNILSSEEARVYLDYKKNSFYKLTSKKLIPFYKPKGTNKLYFLKSDLDAWVMDGRVKTVDELEAETDNYLLNNKK